MSDIIKALKKIEDFDSLDGVSEEEIASAEAELGLSFAQDYREYLQNYGLASAGGHEFTGIVKSKRLNVVDVTLKQKKRFNDIPINAYVVEELGMDGIVIFQDAAGSIYKAVPEMKVTKIADSLTEYVKNIKF